MVIKTILIVMVILVLSEDTASIKKSLKEKKEDRELAEAVNRTLAEEEKKKKEEENIKEEEDETQEDERKEDSSQEGIRDGNRESGQNGTCPTLNSTCPVVECPEPRKCPEVEPCEPCGPCPPIYCKPCSVHNSTVESPVRPGCPESTQPSMTVPVAMAVGACAGLLVTGIATAIGLLFRYVLPTVSGFLFLAIIIIIWYLSSQYPAMARELGGRAVALLREASVALGHRLMEALRHQEQVDFPNPNLLF